MFYISLVDKFKEILEEKNIKNDKIIIRGKTLTNEEAIGKPKRRDFPLLKGKEKMIQAEFKGACGQAFTDMPGYFYGTLKEIVESSLNTNFDRALLIAGINAVCSYLGLVKSTKHCKDEEPEKCAEELVHYIKERYNARRIALIGLQPAMLEKISNHFSLRVLDLDPDNIGEKRSCITIEDGILNFQDAMNWCDLILATGSMITNSTIKNIPSGKPTIFFGVTISGTANIMKLCRFCPYSK